MVSALICYLCGQSFGTHSLASHIPKCRAKYKFPGRQRLCVSNNWGFTKLPRERYQALQAEGRLVKDGINVKVLAPKGPLDSRTLSKLPLSMLGD